MKRIAWVLFEASGILAAALALSGWTVHTFDINESAQETEGVTHHLCDLSVAGADDSLKLLSHIAPSLIFGFPPCTDLALSGARWWSRKREADPLFQHNAIHLAQLSKRLGEHFHCPWAIENPVGAMNSIWRRPDHLWHPFEFGGYIKDSEAIHPIYPGKIPASDAFTKKTGTWCGNGFVFPEMAPVELGGKANAMHWVPQSSFRKHVKSLTPRGFALAVAEANTPPF